MYHKPKSIGNLVAIIATEISISRGIQAKRVNKPNRTKILHITSVIPTKGDMISGKGTPILIKHPTSRVLIKKICHISDKKTPPIVKQIKMIDQLW